MTRKASTWYPALYRKHLPRPAQSLAKATSKGKMHGEKGRGYSRSEILKRPNKQRQQGRVLLGLKAGKSLEKPAVWTCTGLALAAQVDTHLAGILGCPKPHESQGVRGQHREQGLTWP